MSGRFKKGESGNPIGYLPIGDDLKQARKLTRVEFERIANKYLYMSLSDIKIAAASENLPVIEAITVSIMYKALLEGDEKRLNFLMDRVIGQVVRRIRVTTEQEEVVKTIPIEMTDEERMEMLEKMRQRIINGKDNKERAVVDVTPERD